MTVQNGSALPRAMERQRAAGVHAYRPGAVKVLEYSV